MFKRPYIPLQAWKKLSSQTRLTPQALDDPNVAIVAGIDLNGADIAEHLTRNAEWYNNRSKP